MPGLNPLELVIGLAAMAFQFGLVIAAVYVALTLFSRRKRLPACPHCGGKLE